MTEQTTETTPEGTETPETPDEPTTEPEGTDEGTEGRKGNPEAAKWRTKLRETETERDALAARVETMQRAEVRRIATGPGKLVDGDDLFRAVDLADVLTEEGEVDTEAVDAAVSEVRTSKPHLGQAAFGNGAGVGVRNPVNETTWASVINR